MKKLEILEMEEIEGGSAMSNFCYWIPVRTVIYFSAGVGIRAIAENIACWNS